jgi:predicted esterase
MASALCRAQEDVADVPSERIALAEKHVYFLIGLDPQAKEPKPLLLVLPRGDGSEQFNPFVKRIWKNVANEFVVAQLVAVPAEEKGNIVWPTQKLKHKKQDFSTEAFIAAVVKDASARAKIDPQRVYGLGWSSAGPPLYASAGTDNSPVKGFFVAMSVFKPAEMPKLAVVKGKRFYIYHSPEDRVCPIAMARQAKTQLANLGAQTMLVEYGGGHGWKGDVFGDMRAGIDWLEKNRN